MMEEYTHKIPDAFGAVGVVITAILLCKFIWEIFGFLLTYVLAQVLPLSANLKKAGSWAVVTGCTDGIGKAYAEQLASKGLNVVLISRTLSKLTDLAKEIESSYKVKTCVIVADFTKEDIYDDIKVRLAQLDIGVLVNNVGLAHPLDYFDKIEASDFVRNVIKANCMSVAKVTEIILPDMAKKGSGYIINLGSAAGSNPYRFFNLYGSTKTFIEFFTWSLHHEYKSKGITLQCIAPFFVASKMSSLTRETMSVPSATTFVKSALKTVGLRTYTTGFWFHEIQAVLARISPKLFEKYVFWYLGVKPKAD